MCSHVKDKISRQVTGWDSAIEDTKAELVELEENSPADPARAKELKYAINAFELAKRRGDKWPGKK
jgi:hypothetical protein